MKAALTVVLVGLSLAGLSAVAGVLSERTLDEESLLLDPARANLLKEDGTGGYRIDLGSLEAGDRVHVAFVFRDGVNGTLTVRERHAFDPAVAPPPEGALARADGVEGDLAFVAEEAGAFALAIEADGLTPRGTVRLAWDPPQEAGVNPVYFGTATALLRLTALLGGFLFVASWWRKRALGRRGE